MGTLFSIQRADLSTGDQWKQYEDLF
jgi:hypothetical protein